MTNRECGAYDSDRPPLCGCRDELTVSTKKVCLRNCTCPTDGDSCKLSSGCGVEVAIQGRRGMRGMGLFIWTLFCAAVGAVLAAGYVHYFGLPPWLPIRPQAFRPGYAELSEGSA